MVVIILVTAVIFGFWLKDLLARDLCVERRGCWDEVDNVCRKDEPNAELLCLRKNKN